VGGEQEQTAGADGRKTKAFFIFHRRFSIGEFLDPECQMKTDK
jgi:hypothetical protein